MTEPEIKTDKIEEVPVEEAVVTPEALTPAPSKRAERGERGGGREKRGRRGSNRTNRERPRPEFDQKTVSVRRVARVVAGGRRFSLSAAVVAGNRKGLVGVGLGKGLDTALAMDKAFRAARKNMITIPLTKDGSIPHEVYAKSSSARVIIMPAPGRGLIAGGAVRIVLELAGISNVTAKILSPSKNALSNARATIQALSTLRSRVAPRQ